MKIKFVALGSALLVLTSFAGAAFADRIDDRQYRQRRAIEHGRQSGDITWSEGLRLRAEQRRIARLERAYRSDGYLSRGERAHLRALQNAARRHIVHEANDRHHRAYWAPRFGY